MREPERLLPIPLPPALGPLRERAARSTESDGNEGLDAMTEFMFTNRYDALGMALPDPETMCGGPCEGTGVYPYSGFHDGTAEQAAAWAHIHARAHTLGQRLHNAIIERRLSCLWEECDGWHFLTCPDCGGTGLRCEPVE